MSIMKNTNKTTTSNKMSANEKRIAKVKENNAKRIAKSTEKIVSYAEKKDNMVNVLARAIVKRYKKTKDINDKTLTTLIYALGKMMLLAKLKNLQAGGNNNLSENNSWSKINYDMQSNLFGYSDSNNKPIDITDRLNDLFSFKYNRNGDLVEVCESKTEVQDCMKVLADLTNDNETDLLQDAVMPILETILSKPVEKLTVNCLLLPYEYVVQSSTRYSDGSKKPPVFWQKDVSNTINDISKNLSNSIKANKSLRDYTPKVGYIETTIDGDQNAYRTYKKATMLELTAVKDYNNKIITYTADKAMYDLKNKVYKLAKLSPREKMVFTRHIMNGECLVKIAVDCNIDIKTAEDAVYKIKNKIAKYGKDIFSQEILEKFNITDTEAEREKIKKANSNESKKIKILVKHIESKKTFEFNSLGDASKALGVDKSNLAKVLKGKRKATAGYEVKYA